MKKHCLKYIIATVLILSFPLAGCTQQKGFNQPTAKGQEVATYQRPEQVTSAAQAKELLETGNRRFVESLAAVKDMGENRRKQLVKGQQPFAVIVSCSDSRVPPELVFDQALGDLFVVRTAGNVVDPVTIGSVEYAVEHLKSPLIVVMGHMKCGAVKATVAGGEAPGSIGSVVAKIKPSFDKVKATGAVGDVVVEETANENVEATMADLKKSPVIKHLLESGKVSIVGAKYHLDTGKVQWFEQ